MKNTADFLDLLRNKLDLPSDGRLAVYLGMHRQHMSRYRQLHHTFDDELSLRVADILEVDPAYVVACMHHQREKNEKLRGVWEHIATLTMGAAAGVLIFCALPFVSLPNGDRAMVAAAEDMTTVYYVKLLWAYWMAVSPLLALALLAFPRPQSTAKN